MTTIEIEELAPEELHRLTELYRLECERQNIPTSWGDFMQWLGER